MAVNFVKFERGSSSIYASLVRRKVIDENTLYFIYDKDKPEEGGLLYLGYTLIGGTGNISGATSLAELNDVDVTGANNGSLLWYNANLSKWEIASPAQVVENSGADLRSNVSVLSIPEGQTAQEVLADITDTADKGDIAIVGGEPYVYDGSSWQKLTSSDLEDRVVELENKIDAVHSEIDRKIAEVNHLTYEPLPVGTTLNDITEIKDNTIYLVPDVSTVSDNDVYSEYLYVNGKFEKIGNTSPNLTGYVTTQELNTAISNVTSTLENTYVTKTQYNTEVGNIADLLTATGKESTTIVDEVVELYDRLQWKEMTDE